MENLIFSLNATMPAFLLMVLGFVLRKVGWMSESFASQINKFVFRLPLPVLLVHQLGTTDFTAAWDGKFVLFCFVATILSIALVSVISGFVLSDPVKRGEFIQASYRSSAALLGVAYITNIYGNSGMAPLMILGAVPLYNTMAVVVLTLSAARGEEGGEKGLDAALIRKTLWGVITNPIIIGIIIGFAWSLLRIPMPGILDKTLTNVSSLASPLGLIAMGASVDTGKVGGELRPSVIAAFIKLILLCAIFLPVAAAAGFRQEKLVAILVMLGSATTVSSYVMATTMGHEGTLTSNTVVITTVMASFTLTFWIWLTRSLGLI